MAALYQGGPGCLIMLVGPPASGKSYLARRLAERLDARLLQTDVLRRSMFEQPRYTTSEHAAVFAKAHRRIRRLLSQGKGVIFDATNLQESSRRVVYRMADAAQASLLIVLTYAPVEAIEQRLLGRRQGRYPDDQSQADWEVYLKMQRAEPISRPHIVVNTTVDLEQAVQLIANRVTQAKYTARRERAE